MDIQSRARASFDIVRMFIENITDPASGPVYYTDGGEGYGDLQTERQKGRDLTPREDAVYASALNCLQEFVDPVKQQGAAQDVQREEPASKFRKIMETWSREGSSGWTQAPPEKPGVYLIVSNSGDSALAFLHHSRQKGYEWMLIGGSQEAAGIIGRDAMTGLWYLEIKGFPPYHPWKGFQNDT